MYCAKCKNFVDMKSVGGVAYEFCSSCDRSGKATDLIVLSMVRGNAVSSLEDVEFTPEMRQLGERLSYDNAIIELDDVKCPDCKGNVRAWPMENQVYMNICPKCHKGVLPAK